MPAANKTKHVEDVPLPWVFSPPVHISAGIVSQSMDSDFRKATQGQKTVDAEAKGRK